MNDWAEFRHFLYLKTILERGGFRSAADHLNTSQPNLTVQARQFQDFADISLYRKAKDGRISPTETGLAFISLASSVLEVRDEVIAALIAIDRGEIPSVRLGCSPLVDQEVFRAFCSMHKDLLPRCSVRPTHGDTTQLASALIDGTLDAAIVTLPLKHPELRVQELRRDRLVACMRKDHALANKAALRVADLQDSLTILYHPDRHPEAHHRLMEMLRDEGLEIEEYSSASHPNEIQVLVKEGYGIALIREGTSLDETLTTRRLIGVEWTVDMALAYHREQHPKTIPVLARRLRKIYQPSQPVPTRKSPLSVPIVDAIPKAPVEEPIQLKLPRMTG
jgi:DNA-binding transcriptional LysR family regulator